MPPRQSLTTIAKQSYDVIIIGGGINGAGIARELALRGVTVALFDKGDFGSGTSSVSSKLIHGGLRYLEHFHFQLVFESLRERRRLLLNASGLVTPLPFLLPIYKGQSRPPWLIRLGLTLYDILGFPCPMPRHQMLSKVATIKIAPGLNREGLLGAAVYYDAQMNDARLCLANIQAAETASAVVMNYAKVIGINKTGTRVNSVYIQDQETGQQSTVHCSCLLNATGPWSDELLQMFDPAIPKLIRPSKGIHLIANKILPNHAMLITAPGDHRVFFVIPWEQDYSLIGTTDTSYDKTPDSVTANKADIEYLLAGVNQYFPDLKLQPTDVISTFAGLRPLLNKTGKLTAVSREEKIIRHGDNFIAVAGGKYTTYRNVAEKGAREVWRVLGRKGFKSITNKIQLTESFHTNPSPSEPAGERGRGTSSAGYRKEVMLVRAGIKTTLSPQPPLPQQMSIEKNINTDQGEGELANLPHEQKAYLRAFYGSAYPQVCAVLAESPEYLKPLTGTKHLVGEVVYAIRYEYARTATDFIRRRTNIHLTSTDIPSCLPQIEAIFANKRF